MLEPRAHVNGAFPALFSGAPSARKVGDATKALQAMTLWAAESHRRVLVAWVDLVRRGAVAVVIAAALVAAATGAYVVHAFRINTDTEDMLSCSQGVPTLFSLTQTF